MGPREVERQPASTVKRADTAEVRFARENAAEQVKLVSVRVQLMPRVRSVLAVAAEQHTELATKALGHRMS
jgi:hypothetical protein